METQTQTKAKNVTNEVRAKYLAALRETQDKTDEISGGEITGLGLSQTHKVNERILPAMVELGVVKKLEGPKKSYRWMGKPLEDELADKLIATIRSYNTKLVQHSSNKKKINNTPVDKNKEIANKLAQKSLEKVGKIPTIPATGPVQSSEEVITFYLPKKVIINHIVTMEGVTKLTLAAEESNVIIKAWAGDITTCVRLPNKPLQMSDRYQPGKETTYIITNM